MPAARALRNQPGKSDWTSAFASEYRGYRKVCLRQQAANPRRRGEFMLADGSVFPLGARSIQLWYRIFHSSYTSNTGVPAQRVCAWLQVPLI